jgi:hypothetical protein
MSPEKSGFSTAMKTYSQPSPSQPQLKSRPPSTSRVKLSSGRETFGPGGDLQYPQVVAVESSPSPYVGWNSPQSHETLKVSVKARPSQKSKAPIYDFQEDHTKWYGGTKAVKANGRVRQNGTDGAGGSSSPQRYMSNKEPAMGE